MHARATRLAPKQAPRRRYRPLQQRLVAVNAALLIAACLITVVVLAPRKLSSVAVDEAIVLAVALALVTLINLLVVHRFTAPLQKLTAVARLVDLAKPGQRIPNARPVSEAGELATTFNEMLERLEREQHDAARRVLAAHESERLRIAQELHDEVGQTLTAVLLQLSRAQTQLPAEQRAQLGEAQEAARASLEDVRRIATDLRPETLSDLGLASALAALGDGFGRRAGMCVLREIQTPIPPLGGEAELAVYRIAQEALTNVARHSGSHSVHLAVTSDNGKLTLLVRDHGRGLPGGRAPEGNGVRGMRERATLIGANLVIEQPADGPGTELRLELPLNGAPCSA
jgi:two-component system sensor histidine kinase UhpB